MGARPRSALVAFLGAALLTSCDRGAEPAPAPPLPEPAAPAPIAVVTTAAEIAPPRAVLVTIDGVRWEDVFTGSALSMPNLGRLVDDGGVALGGPGCEHDMRASGPSFVSLPGYLEIFGGAPSGCGDNACGPVRRDTVVDEARQTAGSDGDVAVFASWSRYADAVARRRDVLVLSAGAQDGAAPPWAGRPDYRVDDRTASLALDYLEAFRPRLLVVGLGDTDEHAHHGDLADYRRAIGHADDFLGALDATLARIGERDRTAVIVTTDHGRATTVRAHGAAFPESQRVWLAAWGAGIATRGVVCPSAPLRLAHVAGALRRVLGIPGEGGPLARELE